MSCWSKARLGWIDPIEIDRDGTYSIPNLSQNPSCYVISSPYPQSEYLLLENRFPNAGDLDSQIPGGG